MEELDRRRCQPPPHNALRQLVSVWLCGVILPTQVSYFWDQCDHDAPAENFKNFKFFQNPLKILARRTGPQHSAPFSPPGNRAIFSTFWGDFLAELHIEPGEKGKYPLKKIQTIQWRNFRNCRFLSLVVIERVLILNHVTVIGKILGNFCRGIISCNSILQEKQGNCNCNAN